MKKGGKKYVIKIYCAKCNTFLYKYQKEGAGALIKCYINNILEDKTKGNLKCHVCNQKFAKFAKYHNRPANKIIQGKIIIKGHCGR